MLFIQPCLVTKHDAEEKTLNFSFSFTIKIRRLDKYLLNVLITTVNDFRPFPKCPSPFCEKIFGQSRSFSARDSLVENIEPFVR